MDDEQAENDCNYTKYLTLINNCDPDDPLLSETPLGKRLEQIPIAQVSLTDFTQLNQALNLKQLIRTQDGLARDYRGLAELMGFSSIELETRFQRSYNPTKSLIDAYQNKMDLIEESNKHRDLIRSPIKSTTPFNLNELLRMIERLERFDIIDDLMPILIKLASIDQLVRRHDHLPAISGNNNRNNQIVHQHHHHQPQQQQQHQYNNQNYMLNDLDRLTIDDRPKFKTYYDAFMCFAPEDWRHAEELRCLLEEHDKRIATANDLLPGHFEHDALVRLIDLRCRKIIIVLTANFLKSKECEFQLKFASEIAIRSGSPKIIPVLYEDCDDSLLPYMIRVVSKIDMTNKQAHGWQLRKLLCSLEFVLHEQDQTVASQQSTGTTNNNHPYHLQQQQQQQQQQQHSHNHQPMPALDNNYNSSAYHQSPSSSSCNSPTLPAIIFTEAQQDLDESRSDCRSMLSGGRPIVDLAHSQCLSTASNSTYHPIANNDGRSTSSNESRSAGSPTSPSASGSSATPSTNSNPMNWFRQVKRRVLGSQCDSSGGGGGGGTNSSKQLLLASNSLESIGQSVEARVMTTQMAERP